MTQVNMTVNGKPASGEVEGRTLLDGVERAIWGRLPFDGVDFGAVSLNREHGAGIDRIAIHMNHTGPALAGVTAHMSPGKFQIIA